MMAKYILARRYGQTAQKGLFGSATVKPLRLCLTLVVWLAFSVQASAAQESAAQESADNQRLPGKFVWAELVTHDTALSETFYGQLFDWQFDDQDGYRVAWRGEDAIGGFVHRPRKNPEGKSRWIAYISVAQMDVVKVALQDAGARLLEDSRQITGLGELAVYADSEGALFGVIDSAVPDPGDYLADIGDWIWIQLFSHNAGQSSQFYERVGGYQRVDNPHSPGSYLLAREGYARAAIATLSPKHPDVAPAWVPFLRVADIQATLEKAQSLGGKTLVAPRPDLYDNRVAMIEAPDGSAIGILVWQADTTEAAQ